jgi:hypothetical protein
MKSLNGSSLRHALLILTVGLFSATVGCKHTEPEPLKNRPAARPINSIRVGQFKCDNPITGEAVRNVFIEMIVRKCDTRVVTDGDADVVIEGTVTFAHVAGNASFGSTSVVVGNGNNVNGGAVSGVTGVARRNGEVITSASWSYPLGKKKDILSPETVARHAAERLIGVMGKEGLKRR